MNEKLNLVKKLRNVPKGTKFYSLIHGVVEFVGIDDFDINYPIMIICQKNENAAVTSTGRFYATHPDAECVLFPSKEERDWDNFNPCPFQDGELVWAKEDGCPEWYARYHTGIRNVCYSNQKHDGGTSNWDECVKFDQRPF